MAGDRVKISAGLTGTLLGPGSLLVAGAATVAFAFSPIVLAGPTVLFGYSFAVGAGVALMGIAMSIWSLLEGRSAPKGTPHRGAAIGLGVVGIVLCSAVIVTLFAVLLWLPGAGAYTPFGSAPDYR